MRSEFDLLATDRKPEETLSVAFSGQGVTRKIKLPGDGERTELVASFCSTDVDINKPESLLSLDDL